MSTNSLGYNLGQSAIAQSFFVDDPKGIFATKIQLFFKKAFTATADLQYPISLHIRPMRNGIPSDTEIIPGSTVYVNYNLVNTSNDGTASTDFVFDEPIFLEGFTDYSIVVYADTKEYEIFIAEIDETVVGSASARVNKDPNLGTLFYTSNGATFTANQKQDMKFNISKANFTTAEGVVKFKNGSVPRHLLDENPLQTTTGDSAVTVYSINHGLQVNDTVSILGASDVGGITANTLNGDHTITAVDAGGFRFKVNTPATSSEIGGGDEVLTTKNIPYSIVWPTLQTLKPTGTGILGRFKGVTGKSFAGTETPYTVEPDFSPINLNNSNISFDKKYVIAADSIADAEITVGAPTAELEVIMNTSDPSLSPVIDLQRASLTLIDNIIDNPDSAATNGFNIPLKYVDETEPSGGSVAAKHITTVTTLGSSAVGLQVILAANRPKEAGIKLYYRVATENDLINTKNWIEVESTTNNPSDEVPSTFRDYEYLIGGRGGNLDAFISFQLKIVMTSTNSAKVPVIQDLRAIALSV